VHRRRQWVVPKGAENGNSVKQNGLFWQCTRCPAPARFPPAGRGMARRICNSENILKVHGLFFRKKDVEMSRPGSEPGDGAFRFETSRAEKGKPPERTGRKVAGLRPGNGYGSRIAGLEHRDAVVIDRRPQGVRVRSSRPATGSAVSPNQRAADGRDSMTNRVFAAFPPRKGRSTGMDSACIGSRT